MPESFNINHCFRFVKMCFLRIKLIFIYNTLKKLFLISLGKRKPLSFYLANFFLKVKVIIFLFIVTSGDC